VESQRERRFQPKDKAAESGMQAVKKETTGMSENSRQLRPFIVFTLQKDKN
jgi:hypothetical protein